MSIVVMQVFVSLMLVAGSLVLFLHSVRQRDLDHADRLALAPLEADDAPPSSYPTPNQTIEIENPCKQDKSNTTIP